jgi:hypothetical protein
VCARAKKKTRAPRLSTKRRCFQTYRAHSYTF